MSNQVYASLKEKYFASQGPNYYGIAASIPVAANATVKVPNSYGTQQDLANSFEIVSENLVCKSEGVYNITAKFEYINSVLAAGETNVSLNISVVSTIVDGSTPCSATINTPTLAAAGAFTKYATLTFVGFLYKGDVVGITLQNNTNSSLHGVDLINTNTLISTARLY